MWLGPGGDGHRVRLLWGTLPSYNRAALRPARDEDADGPTARTSETPSGSSRDRASVSSGWTPARRFGHDKATSVEATLREMERLPDLQDRLWAEAKHSVLVVLQGIDAAGKDGTIAKVMEAFNPQGCPVTSFKVPTPEELGHDFLWRVHQRTPRKGEIGDLQPLALRGRPRRPRPRARPARRSGRRATTRSTTSRSC